MPELTELKCFARRSRAIALAAAMLPIAARADDVFVCRDGKARITYVTVNAAHSSVRMISGQSPARCIMTLSDGVYGPAMSAPTGEFCLFATGDQASTHQYMRVKKGEIQFGFASDDGNRWNVVLNTETGLMDSPGGTEECHRAHS